jgi:dTDP-glucose 4,6-dehydratase
MKILVTGGAGFIGSNFIHYMLENYSEYEIVCLDKLTYAGNLSNLEQVLNHNNFTFVKGDITDQGFIENLFGSNGFDTVVNFAAESHVDRSISGPAVFLETNYTGVFNLVEVIRKYPSIRFHQVSTDEVYGDLPLDRPDLLFNEQSSFRPSSPYSATKAAADLLVLAYYRTYGLKVTVSHSSNNYGPYQFPEKLIPLVIQRAIEGKTIPVYGDGLNVRDWLHVNDHCAAIDKIIHQGKYGESYSIGSSNEETNLAIVKKILKNIGKTEKLIEFVKDRAGHDLRYAIDSSKMNRELDWYPKIDFDQGLEETILWYKSNKSWIESVINQDYIDYYKSHYEK